MGGNVAAKKHIVMLILSGASHCYENVGRIIFAILLFSSKRVRFKKGPACSGIVRPRPGRKVQRS